jgi:hypothetical protein
LKAKLVYESLEFERGLEPIKAMGIGIYNEIQQWCKKLYGIIPSDDEVLLHYCILAQKFDYIKYLIEIRKVKIPESLINTAINIGNDKIILYLISNGDQKVINYINSKKKR